MSRRAAHPGTVRVHYRGVPHDLDLGRCWRALLGCEIEGEFSGMDGLAKRAGCSRSTASRFFSGRSVSLPVTLRILTALGLAFADVAREIAPEAT
jgi:hypothetical protein